PPSFRPPSLVDGLDPYAPPGANAYGRARSGSRRECRDPADARRRSRQVRGRARPARLRDEPRSGDDDPPVAVPGAGRASRMYERDRREVPRQPPLQRAAVSWAPRDAGPRLGVPAADVDLARNPAGTALPVVWPDQAGRRARPVRPPGLPVVLGRRHVRRLS